MSNERRRVLVGVGRLAAKNGTPVRWTREQVQAWADREAAKKKPAGFWTGVVCETERGWMVNFGGQREKSA